MAKDHKAFSLNGTLVQLKWVLLLITILYISKSTESATQTFGSSKIQPGEIVYCRGFPIMGWYKLVWPYHYFYAITPSLLWNIYRVEEKKESGELRSMVKLVTLDLESEKRSGKVQIKTQKAGPRGLSAKLGIILAKRMVGLNVPYHTRRCNCRHYVDYVAFGRTFGSFWNPAYWPVHNECPLHRRITENDLKALASDSTFYLQIKSRDGLKDVYKLNLQADFMEKKETQNDWFPTFDRIMEARREQAKERFGADAVPSKSRQGSFGSGFQYPQRTFTNSGSPNRFNK